MANGVTNMFEGSMSTKDITKYTLMRGVTDFSNLTQFNNFESGYSFLIVLKIPTMLENLCAYNDEYRKLITNYRHILEYDFVGIDGFEDIGSDTQPLSNGISELNVITKVNMQSASQFSMKYFERSGLVLTKVHELFLRGIKDPKTQVKTYNGLLRPSAGGGAPIMAEAGYEYETFQFLYFVTDNTCLHIEKAYLIASAQPTGSPTGEISNSARGEIEWKSINLQFNGIPLVGPAINAKAQEFLNWINDNTVFEEAKFGYQALSKMPSPGNTGGIDASSPRI